MISIAALNDTGTRKNAREPHGEIHSTKEAQEEAALTLYKQALQLQNHGKLDEAQATFLELLGVSLLRLVSVDDTVDNRYDATGESTKIKSASQQSRLLKYSAYKNLANIASKSGRHEDAMEFYLEATSLDSSDVTMWFKTGITAIEIKNYPLAKFAFLEGIACNPNHWPCLDQAITMLYVLNNYHKCLLYIANALERNSCYVKGLAIRDQIFKEQPSLQRDTEDFFLNCDPEMNLTTYDDEVGQKFIEEALEMRRIKRELCRPPPRLILDFTKPITNKTWKNVGESLFDLYDFIKKSKLPISLSCSVNVKSHVSWLADVKEGEVTIYGGKTDTSPKNFSRSDSISNEQGGSPPLVTSVIYDAREQGTTLNDEIDCNMELDDGQSLSQGDTMVLCESVLAGSKKSRKRRSFYFECMDAASKRRSPRVKNTGTKKQPEYVNYYKLLQTFLPSSLIMKGNERVDADASSNNQSESSDRVNKSIGRSEMVRDIGSGLLNYKLEECQYVDVSTFLESVCKNMGVLDIMYKYLVFLGGKESAIWPSGLSDVFIEVYNRWRNHINHPSLFSEDYAKDDINDEVMATLVFCELKVDKMLALTEKTPTSMSSSIPSGVSSPTQVFVDLSEPRFNEDINFLVQCMGALSGSINELEFSSRVWLLRARIMILENQMDFAAYCLEEILSLLQDEIQNSNCILRINVTNCKVDNVINLEEIQKKLESLQYCQSLEELQRSYECGNYKRVVELLIPTFKKPCTSNTVTSQSNIPERHAQLLLLQDALFNLGDQKKSLYWGEASFQEALLQYDSIDLSTSSSSSMRHDWGTTVTKLLCRLERCIAMEPSIVHALDPIRLRRFIKNLIHLIHTQMRLTSSSGSSSIGEGASVKTVVPWILLYQVVRQEEQKIHSLMVKSIESTPDDNDGSFAAFGQAMPSSLMLLFNAHEHLGRRGWCCQSDGALLLLCAELFVDELRKSSSSNPHPFKEELEVNSEQCFFCLYGHPNRKMKAKHLQEHGTTSQVSLSWQRARPLFDYFKPEQLPEFDSYKVSTISSEIEYLLRRILTLVPTEEDPVTRVESINAYIESSDNDLPTFDVDFSTKPITCEMYYLLADYYFKNKEQGKAIKFYVLDVCVKPDRFDSWAGMALARSSQIEQKLNSSDLRSEGQIYRRASAAFRCFKRALELNPSAASLWIEMGSLSYMLHSYASRQLKQRVQFDLSAEMIQMLKAKRTEMLETARQCFRSANRCEESSEEEWLHHYMLGKIAEKLDCPPHEFLAHYKLAAHHLHMDGALYPTRIQYHSPPHLTMEALEVYYRTHASVLKYLLRHEGRPFDDDGADENDGLTEQVMQRLKEIMEEPFYKFQQKRHSDYGSSDTECGSALIIDHSKKIKKPNALSNDHDYFKRKRKSSSSEDLSEPRQDSSSESQDSAAVKDLLNSIVCVISERHSSKQDDLAQVNTIVVGDAKIYRPPADRKQTIVVEVATTAAVEIIEEENNEKSAPVTEANCFNDVEIIEGSSDIEIIKVTGVQDHHELARRCIDALKHCLQRFPQHYKSLYRLSHYYATSKYHKNLQWSSDYLVGPKISWQQCPYMATAALFAERKNTNFFNGIWRIPIDEIDRPGSFASHMYRSIKLLVRILEEARSFNLLVQITVQLHREPDAGKKYLRDVDRLYLARLTYDRTVKTLLRRMRTLCRVETDSDPLAQPSAVRHMLDTYRAWQNLQKVVSNPQAVNAFLEKAYIIFRRGVVDGRLPCFEQAVRFCQQQMLIAKISRMPTSGLMSASHSKMSSVSTRDSNYIRMINTSSKGKSSQSSLPQHAGHLSAHSREDVNQFRSSVTKTTTKSPASNGASSSKSVGITSGSNVSHVLSSPNLLTADVQSKIKSLDPIVEPFRLIHQAASQQMSGFQLEFLRQITANFLSPPPPPPPPPPTTPPSSSTLPSSRTIPK